MSIQKKICFAASSGGHFEQLMRLYPMMKENSFIITEYAHYEVNTKSVKTYYLKQINRKELGFPLLMIYNCLKSLMIFLHEKPDYVISTGALATIPICLLAKLFRKKLIFIESFAKVTTPTLTGKLMYRFADRFYVQWEEMLSIYPGAIFKGSIY